MGSIFTAGFGILLLLLRTNWILRSLNKMIEDKEMKEILDEMKKEDEGEEESDVGSGNNDDFVGLKERSHVPADSETSAAPADPSSKERAEGLKREEMKCSQLGYYRNPMLIIMVVLPLCEGIAKLLGAEEISVTFTKMKMRKKKKKKRTGRSMEEND